MNKPINLASHPADASDIAADSAVAVEQAAREDRVRASPASPPETGLQSLCLIENVGDTRPLGIVPVVQCQGHAASAEEAMAARVKWANGALFHILSRDVPREFAPYNAIIRVRHTEDMRRDYLAVISD